MNGLTRSFIVDRRPRLLWFGAGSTTVEFAVASHVRALTHHGAPRGSVKLIEQAIEATRNPIPRRWPTTCARDSADA